MRSPELSYNQKDKSGGRTLFELTKELRAVEAELDGKMKQYEELYNGVKYVFQLNRFGGLGATLIDIIKLRAHKRELQRKIKGLQKNG